MTEIEERLRAELKAAAAQAQPHLLRELTLPARRRSRRSARWLAPAAAVLAVAIVVLGVRIALRPAPPGPAGRAGLLPQFYVAVPPWTHGAIVARSRTGATLSRIEVPGARVSGVSAAADDRTFALSASSGSGAAEVTRFYLVHLSASGRPGGLTVLPLAVHAGAAGYDVTGMALAPDGSRLAVAVVPLALEGMHPTPAHRSRIEITAPGLGAARAWVAPAEVNISHLSWATGGQRLGYLSEDVRGLPRQVPVTRVNVLDTTRPGPDLTTSSRSVTLRTGTSPVDAALISPSGDSAIAWVGPPAHGNAEVLAEYSMRTGQRQRVLYRGPGHGNFIVQADVLSADPSGRHLLVNFLTATGNRMLLARVDNGQFTGLPVPGHSLLPTQAAW